MSPEEFTAQAQQGFTRIAVTRTILADLETPLSVYLKLADAPYSYLLESVQGGEKWGQFSIIGLPARRTLQVRRYHVQEWQDGHVVAEQEVADPLAWLDAYHAQYRCPTAHNGSGEQPRFTGGLVGYMGYDTVRYIEPKLDVWHHTDTLDTPDMLFMVSDELVVFDNLRGTLQIVVNADPREAQAWEQANQRLDEIETALWEPLPARSHKEEAVRVEENAFASQMGEQGYQDGVERCVEHIVAGDCFQIVLSQRMSVPLQAPPLDVYRALRTLNPSPYMYLLELGDHQVVGSSPEILARLEDGEVTVRPLAGTRPRGASAQEDLALEEELLADPKELAEHLMLIDLGRNDVGRISEPGTVKVTDKMAIERYSHVMHIVSNVTGTLKPGLGAIDVVRASFPAGTLSGSPKVRAMEIIDDIEPHKRGIYGGAVGYWSWSGNMDMAIAIRTAVIKDGSLHIQAGAGVVYDSVPQSEWNETMNKARAVFRAVSMAEKGL